jgi:uncharacterized protein YodC (DUF2158 family)
MSGSSVVTSFTPGTVVRLKSGSPAMTVSVTFDNGAIRTFWFHNGELREGNFPACTLRDENDYGAETRYRNER